MRILFFGDLFARSGRDALLKQIQTVKAALRPDVVIANAENAAAGAGITISLAEELWAAGIDCLTSGNHIWRQKDVLGQIDRFPRLLRPLNYPAGTPGQGSFLHSLPDGHKILIASIMGQLDMMPQLDDPFAAADRLLDSCPLSRGATAILIDFHAEATSEKYAFGHYLDGRVSAVLGTHTHVPTADDHILEKGTAFQSDVGMCGDFDSCIGTRKDIIVRRFTRKTNSERFEPAAGDASLCGTLIVTNDSTGLADSIEAFQFGGALKSRGITMP